MVDICGAANRWYILNYESIYCVYLESASHICTVLRQKRILVWLELAEDVFVSIFFLTNLLDFTKGLMGY